MPLPETKIPRGYDPDAGNSYRSGSRYAVAVRDAVAEAMGASVAERLEPEPSCRPSLPAGADVPESDAANRVASEQDASLSRPDAAHDDGVKHGSLWTEAERQAWLRRVQAER